MYSFLTSFPLLLLLLTASQVRSHSYHLGDCPTIEPAKEFDIERFLGKWYVIEKTKTRSSCVVNIYDRDEEHPGQFKLEQISNTFLLGMTSPDKKYHYTGKLSLPDIESPAAMRVNFPLNVAGDASYTVFTTDYTHYAGVFTCQQLSVAHRRSISILSRRKTLEKHYVDMIRNQLAESGIDPLNLSIINQGNCTESFTLSETNSNDTFRASNIAKVFSKAGEKLGDGFETVADSAKKVYNRVRGDHEDSKEELADKSNPKDDVEWLL